MLYSDDEGHGDDDSDDGYGDDDLGWAVRVWARDVVGSLHHLERYVLLHALQQGIFKVMFALSQNDLFAKGAAALVQLDHGGGGAVVAADLA